jgi:hypothetical protein
MEYFQELFEESHKLGCELVIIRYIGRALTEARLGGIQDLYHEHQAELSLPQQVAQPVLLIIQCVNNIVRNI